MIYNLGTISYLEEITRVYSLFISFSTFLSCWRSIRKGTAVFIIKNGLKVLNYQKNIIFLRILLIFSFFKMSICVDTFESFYHYNQFYITYIIDVLIIAIPCVNLNL